MSIIEESFTGYETRCVADSTIRLIIACSLGSQLAGSSGSDLSFEYSGFT